MIQQIEPAFTMFGVWMWHGFSCEDAKRGLTKFREVEGEGTAWYASRTEAVGLGRVVPSSSSDFPSKLSAFFAKS